MALVVLLSTCRDGEFGGGEVAGVCGGGGGDFSHTTVDINIFIAVKGISSTGKIN